MILDSFRLQWLILSAGNRWCRKFGHFGCTGHSREYSCGTLHPCYGRIRLLIHADEPHASEKLYWIVLDYLRSISFVPRCDMLTAGKNFVILLNLTSSQLRDLPRFQSCVHAPISRLLKLRRPDWKSTQQALRRSLTSLGWKGSRQSL